MKRGTLEETRAFTTLEQWRLLRALSEDFERVHTEPGYVSKRPELWAALLESAKRRG